MSTGFTDVPAALLETLFAEAPFGVAYLDADLRYVRVNEPLARMNGVSVEEHIGRTPEEVLPAAEATHVMGILRDVLDTGEAASVEIDAETPAEAGGRRMFAGSYVPVTGDGATVGLAAIVVEITGERIAESRLSQLYELEHAARERAEAAEDRARFIAEAGALLDASLDLRTTLQTLARILVPRLADLCMVDMAREDGTMERLAVAHADPGHEDLVWELTRRWPSPPDASRGIPRVIRTGETEVIPEVTEEVLAEVFPDPEHRAEVRTLGLRSAIAVPLRARERTLGTLTIALCDEGPPFRAADVSLAEDVAQRASLAVDNARLFTELRRADEAQRFLAEATQALASSLDWDTTIETVARLATAGAADCCTVDVLDTAGEMRQVALVHVDRAKAALMDETRRLYPVVAESSRGARAVTSGSSGLYREIGDADYRALAEDEEHLQRLREIGVASALWVPMVARGRILGVIGLAITESDRRFGPEDLALAEELGRRAAVAADNARLYSERTRVARTLQRSLVPAQLPHVPGIDAAVRFRSAGDGLEVGGDFYDVLALPGGRWAAVVGDVCGKGAPAAALTALARHTVRAAARYEDGPIGVLHALNDAIKSQSAELMFCTAALAWIEPSDGRTRLRIALGGHLPPVIVRAGGEVERIAPRGALLGVFDSLELDEADCELEPGDAIVLYTDGVTDAGAPRDPLGEDRLAELLAAHAGSTAGELTVAVQKRVAELDGESTRDDVAVLVLRME